MEESVMNTCKNSSLNHRQQVQSQWAAAGARPLFEALEQRQMMIVAPTATTTTEPTPTYTKVKAPAPISATPVDRYLIEPRI
jgi:hypothetical protein